MSDLCINIIYAFVLTSPWEWQFIAEVGEFIVYGQLIILYNLCAYVGAYKTFWVCGLAFLWENQKYLAHIMSKVTVGLERWHQPFNINFWSYSDTVSSLVFQLSGPCFGIQSLFQSPIHISIRVMAILPLNVLKNGFWYF